MFGERAKTDGGEVSKHGGAWFRWRHGVLIALSLIGALIISSAWLVFPYLVEGRHLLSDVGASVKDQRLAKSVSIGQYLTRFAEGPGEADVEVMFATPRYFEIADKARAVAEYRPDRYLVFVVSETVHVSRLPQELLTATLVVDGREYLPVDVEGPTDVEHHRVTTVRFARVTPSGERVVKDGSRTLELWITNAWDPSRTRRTATWQLPITYPEKLVSVGLWTPAMLVAMSAGLLSAVFTPCLLQLIIIYMVTLTGLGAEEIGRAGTFPNAARRKMLVVALSFVTAFIALYTGAGALIGLIGKEAHLLLAEWSRAISIGSGILVIGLGIWVGIKARAPLVCRIPMAAAMGRMDRRGIVGPALVAAGFSLGCSACFGGAIIATLLIYVGALGSAPVGALVMFMFSLGVAIPFLLAALFLSRVMPMMDHLAKYAPHVGFASMVVIILFGVVLVTDNFHVLSSMIYPLLGLG